MTGPLVPPKHRGAGATTRFSANFRASRAATTTLLNPAWLLKSLLAKVAIQWKQ
jgi:hypothetical protein